MNYIELKSGKRWPLNTAYNGDCLDFMKELPDKCIDLVLTDPPYGIKRYMNKDGGNSKKITTFGKAEAWNNDKPTAEIFNEIFRISKYQIIWGANNFTLPESEYFIVWDKQQMMPSFAQCEQAWTNVKVPAKIFTMRSQGHGDRIHPTQKPLKLFKWCLEKYAPENAIVLDPFLGSFTTAVACHSHGLNWIGCEKDADYFKAGMERYETECLQNLLDF